MRLSELTELEQKVEEMGVNPMELYMKTLNSYLNDTTPTQDEIDKVVKILNSSSFIVEDKNGYRYATRVKRLGYGRIGRAKLDSILEKLNYKNHRIGNSVFLSVPLGKLEN